MDPLFYDDLEYGSSLLQSPDPYATLSGEAKEERNMSGSGRNGNFEMRSILKNNNHHIKYNGCYTPTTTVRYQRNNVDYKPSCFNRIIRPCAAEFIAVFLCIFTGKMMENELSMHAISSTTERRIVLQALTDSVVMLAMVMAFQTVHLNPMITLAEFFALTTAWPMCCAMIVMQILASVTAIAAFAVFQSGALGLQLPIIITPEHIDAAYHLVLSQFIGTLLVTITHLLITTRTGSGPTALARPGDTPLSVVAAVFVSSLLCLSNSTIGWNPLLAFALATYGSIDYNFGPLQMQGIFWIGPCLASLFACFLYRLLFVSREYRLIKCNAWSGNDDL